MSQTIVIMNDEEVNRYLTEAEAGFGTLSTEKGSLPLKALDVQARIDGLAAQVEITQTFVNTHAQPLEATYIFPLPDRGAVTGFRLEVAGRIIDGLLKERAQARREYDEAIQAGHRAAIAEEERPNVFTLRVGNLPAGETAKVHLTLSTPLQYDAGEVTFRFPLVVAPRYIPGAPLPGDSVGEGIALDTDAVPDASRITPPVLLPGFPNPVRLSLAVDLAASDLHVSDVRCSLHSVTAQRREDGGQRIELRPGERLNRDFILRYRAAADAVQSNLSFLPDAVGHTASVTAASSATEGAFMLTLLPPDDCQNPFTPAPLPRGGGEGRTKPPVALKPRDVVFVLDRSGSMGGWKMVAARRAVGRMVDTLNASDRFTVLAFDDVIETPPWRAEKSLVPATDHNRFRCLEFLSRIDARGGTEMAQPLDRAVTQLANPAEGRQRALVLITDGQVGNEDQMLRDLGPRLKGIRIYTLGIDTAVNDAFLRRLATLGGGSFDLVESEDRLDQVTARVHRRLAAPVLTGVRVEAQGVAIDPGSLTPGRLPDLFPGAPLTIMGRYQGKPEGRFVIEATDDAGRPWRQTVSVHVSPTPALASLWARARLRDLEDRYVVAGGDEQLEKEIVGLSLRFGVLSRFTAFVAVDRAERVNVGGAQQCIVQPVEVPEGWAMPMAAPSAAMSNVLCCMAAPEAEEASEDFAMLADNVQQAIGGSGVTSKYRMGSAKMRSMLAKQLPSQSEATAEVCKKTPTVLFAYRQAAHDMLEDLQAYATGTPEQRLRALGMLSVKLKAMLEDMQSIGASAAELQPLRDLQTKLAALQTELTPTAESVDAAWAETEAVLQAFADAAQQGRGGQFWK